MAHSLSMATKRLSFAQHSLNTATKYPTYSYHMRKNGRTCTPTLTPQNSSRPLKKGGVGGGWREASRIRLRLALVRGQRRNRFLKFRWPVRRASKAPSAMPVHGSSKVLEKTGFVGMEMRPRWPLGRARMAQHGFNVASKWPK